MNWVAFSVVLVVVLFNFLGTGIYHYEWKNDKSKTTWKCKEFYLWTVWLMLFGIAYCILRLILLIKNKK